MACVAPTRVDTISTCMDMNMYVRTDVDDLIINIQIEVSHTLLPSEAPRMLPLAARRGPSAAAPAQ